MHAVIRLTAGEGEVAVVPAVGGALASFRVHGVDVLRPADEEAIAAGDVRRFASYPLVPYSNRIARARLRVGDETFALNRNFGEHPHAIHGVGWQRPWRVVAQDEHRLALELVHRPEEGDEHAWPFAFRARQAFDVAWGTEGIALTMTIAIASEAGHPFPFGLGFHPFFPRRPGTTLAFRAQSVWQTDATHLPSTRTGIPSAWEFGSGRAVADVALDNVFAGWDGVATIGWPREGLRVTTVADRALSHLVVYVPRDGGHFAVEPVTHMTDAFNRAALGEQDTGTRVLPPGASFSCTMRLNVDRSCE